MSAAHPAHDRIAKANDIAHGERVRQQIAALEACLVDHSMPKHPAPGCPCHGCDGRDRAKEARAEERAAEKRGDYDSEWTRVWAEYRAEMNEGWWQ